ncbi:MAG: DUF1850 domain-containing protein [Oscillospiraceae bacterium]|nr:DUF1850 domain-containing protein [Oscillospiraceae bacterium]
MRKKLFVAGVVTAALATIFLISLFFFRAPYLVLTNDQTGVLLFRHRIDEGDTFSVSYIHSVNQSPVTEIYRIKQGQIVLTALEFETFGAGMPTEVDPGQTLIHLPAGGFRIEGFNRVIGDLRYLIGHMADLTLHVDGQDVPLNTLDASGQSVHFAFRQLNIWQRGF